MIDPITEYQYLGNGMELFNSNMHLFNIRVDNLYSDKEKWNSLYHTINSISADIVQFQSHVMSISSTWNGSSDLVYNTEGYWEEPIMLVYQKTSNYAANYLEIENWLNLNFPANEFSPTQIIRCDFLCKNYSDEIMEGYRLTTFDPYTVDNVAKTYDTTAQNIYTYLGLVNQLNAIISIINIFLKKNNKKDMIIDKIKDLSLFNSYVTYDRPQQKFQSTILDTFNDSDLKSFHSYLYQYNLVYGVYLKYISIADIPAENLLVFDLRDVTISNGGNFFYKNINGRWTYYPYTHIEFCASGRCGDCYSYVDVNTLYVDRNYCFAGTKYLLYECPYGVIEAASMESALIVEAPDGYDSISNLLS
jgi:hypothetical protein